MWPWSKNENKTPNEWYNCKPFEIEGISAKATFEDGTQLRVRTLPNNTHYMIISCAGKTDDIADMDNELRVTRRLERAVGAFHATGELQRLDAWEIKKLLKKTFPTRFADGEDEDLDEVIFALPENVKIPKSDTRKDNYTKAGQYMDAPDSVGMYFEQILKKAFPDESFTVEKDIEFDVGLPIGFALRNRRRKDNPGKDGREK